MPHIDMTSVMFNISTPKSSTFILLSGDFHRIGLHKYAIYLEICTCVLFYIILAFRLSLDVTIIVDNTI